ncbi:hypothetical protein JCM10212_003171 [Sporobolomyces blumeae]
MPRSPSPAHSSHSATKRRRYDPDDPPSHDHSPGRDGYSRRDRHRDRDHERSHRGRRDDDDYHASRRRSHRDYDHDERDRDRDSHRGDRDRDRDYGHSHRDRDRDRDRDYYRSSRSHRDDRDDRVPSRRDRDDEARYSGSKRSRDYDDGYGPSRTSDRRSRPSARDELDRSPPRRARTRSPGASSSAARERSPAAGAARTTSANERDLASASPLPSSNAVTTATNDSSSTAAAAEDEKLRIKREKLEAWKKKKAQEAAASATTTATASPAPASPKPAPAVTHPDSSKPPSGLPAKPATSLANSLPSKPVSLAAPTKPLPKPASSAPLGSSPADATAAAAAAAAAISSRLGGGNRGSTASNLAFQKSHALPSSLPAKPSFSFAGAGMAMGMGPMNGKKTTMRMGGEEDDGARKIGMIKFEDVESGTAGAADDDDDDDDEDLEGGASYKGGAEAREKRMRALVEQESLQTGATEAEPVKMEIDGAPSAEGAKEEAKDDVAMADEDEEVDELDAFMSQVNKEVKNVEKEDRKKLRASGGQKTNDPTENGEEEDEEDAENEEEQVGMTAKDILALAAKKVKRGRELHAPDHSKIDYLPFRKAFYSAPPEVQELSQEQVDLLRLEMDDIKIRGADPPKPATKWSYFGLPAACIDVIKGLEYVAPTSIQAQAIPAIMSGRDIIGVAKTGSGKTMAFILPMFRHIKDQPPLRPMDGPVAMIMTPTRELATQIYKECKPFLKALGLRASCAYGGMPLKDNIADMKRGSEVIVCTPGRMIELLTTNSGRLINLQRVTYLVLDEADRMFDMGFEPQVMKIIGQIRPDRQTVLFSATFPRQMEALARKVLRRPLEITVGGRSVVADTITQVVEVRPEDSKFNRMLELLGKLFNEEQDARALVFVERQESADKLFVELKNKNYTCMPLHGGREQVDRDQTIVDFKNGSCPIVIATSVAARGLDVKQLKLVLQYDVPNHMEDYVHRAGRTGRAGNKGTCVTFVTPEQDRYSLDILKALQASNAPIPPELKAMAEAFAEKVKAGKEKAAGSGFGGKGLEKLDDERAAASRAERAAYGEAGGAEKKGEDGEAGEGEAGGDDTAKNVADLEIEIMRGPAPDLAKGKVQPAAGGVSSNAAQEADEAAKAAEKAALAAGKSAAAAAAESVRAKFNAMLKSRRGPPPEPDNSTEAARRRDPDATDYHAIVWINDYPQKARWKVTNKETMVHFVESTGASITNKGIFYEPGKEPGPNDLPKLHLLIESNEEFRVKHAIAEIKQALIEGATMALEAEQRQPGVAGGASAGRYSVV